MVDTINIIDDAQSPIVTPLAGSDEVILVRAGQRPSTPINPDGFGPIRSTPDEITAASLGSSGIISTVRLTAGLVETTTTLNSAVVDSSITSVQTLGYSSVGDNGGATFVYSAVDPGHDMAYPRIGGGYWVLDGVNFSLEMFGDSNDDYAQALIRSESFFSTGVRGSLRFAPSIIRVPRTIYYPITVSDITGYYSTSIRPMSGATYTRDVMFCCNVDSSGNWISSFPGVACGVIGYFQLRNDLGSSVFLRGFDYGGAYTLTKITALDFCQIAHSRGTYSDQIIVDGLTMIRQITAPGGWSEADKYAFATAAIGDGMSLDNIHTNGISPDIGKGVYVSGCRGGTITNSINGDHKIVNSDSVTISGGHFETGTVEANESNISVRGSLFFNQDGTPVPINSVNANAANGEVYSIDVEDVSFVAVLVVGTTIPPTTLKADINRATGYLLTVRNCFRSYDRDGGLSKRGRMGCIISDNGALSPAWTSKSGSASIAGRMSTNGTVVLDITSETTSTTTTLVATGSTSAGSLAAGTYYYAMQILHDTARMVGHTCSATATVTLPSTGLVLLTCANPSGVTHRFYRGTSVGSYDMYVDIPAAVLGYPYDYGTHMNGFPWTSRAAGAVDAVAITGYFGPVTFEGQNASVVFSGGSSSITAALSGTWRIGDEIIFSNSPTDGGSRRIGGIKKITTGSGNVAGTDWLTFYDV